MTDTFYRPISRVGPEATTGMAGDQPGAIPVLDGVPTRDELPTDQTTGEPVALMYLNASTDMIEVASPDGSGGVVDNTLLDISADVTIGDGLIGGLL